MEWFILSRDMHVLCAPSTDSPDSLPIFNDKQTILLSNNTVVSTYDFSVQRKHPDAQYLQMGNYIVFVDKYHKTKMYTLMSHDGDDLTDTWHAEDVGLDLLNESSEKWDYTGHPHDIAWYLNNLVIGDSGWTIGINEASTLSRALKFDGETDTQLRRLGDIANQFDGAEVDFTIEMNGAKVTKQVINIYKKVGSSVTQGRYIDSLNLTSLHSSGSIADLVTALKPFGGQMDMPEGQEGEAPRITIADVAYDDGRYYSPKGHLYLYDREAHQQWSRFRAYNYANQGEFDGYIVGSYTYDTKDPNELLNRALTDLKSRNKPSETYEANLLDINADIGDYVQIAHNQYNPPIYLSARVEQVENCYTANGQDIGVLGDYRKLESNIDPRIKEMLSALENQIKAHYMWIRYAEDDKGKGMTSVPTVNTKYVVILVNKPTAVPSDDPADYAGHWQLIQGQDGKDGIPGATGADGKTSYTHFAYANNVSGTADFSLDDPTERSYMGVYSDFTKADSTNPSDYVWSYTKGETGPEGMQGAQGPQGDIGIPGKPGADGKTSYTHVAYADNDEGGGFSQNPANKAYMGWYSDFTQADSTDVAKYAWSLIKGSDGLDGAQGIAGPKGADGKTPYTHIAYADTATGGGLSQLPDGKKYIGMYVDFTENDSSDPQKYAWSLIKGADGKDGTPGKDGIAGKDGIGIKSTNVTYQASSNGTTAPTGAWTANVPMVPAGQYLWTRTIWTYTDNTNETSYSVAYIAKDGNSGKDGIAGKDGVGIKSTTITYATSTSGTVTPTTGWVTNPPAVSPGQFMWTKTVWHYTDNSSETGYSVAQAGNTGATGPVGKDGIAGKDGVGIKSTAIAYAQSTSGTTPPTTGWTAGVPTLIKGQYLWTKTVWTYTDSSAETGYTVSYNAKDGNTGADGVAGKDGVGISSTVIEYVGAVSGTSKPASGWSATIPTVPAGQYLWTRTTWKYTDGTSEQGFTNALMGRTGAKGDTGAQGLQGLQGPTGTQGIAGPKGADGKTQYTHIAYANSADGVTNFSTSDSNRMYIGMYVDFNVNDSTTPSDYSWTLVKGADGSQGTPGKPGVDGKTPYLHTAYSWSADGTDRLTTVYPGENLIRHHKFRGVNGALVTEDDGNIISISAPYSDGGKQWGAGIYLESDTVNRTLVIPWRKSVIISFEIWSSVDGNWYGDINTYPMNGANSWNGNDNDDTSKRFYYTNTHVYANKWTKCGYSITNDDSLNTPNAPIYDDSGIGIRTINPDETINYRIRNLKYEIVDLIDTDKDIESRITPWTPSPLDDLEGAYPTFIGTYTDYIADDSTEPSKYTWAKLRGEQGPKGDTGEDGVAGKDGVGIKSTQIMYAQSTSGTTAPTTGWTAQVPTLIKGQYLWTQTTWLYTDSTGEAGYTVSYNAKDGNSGANGVAGKDGVGIKSTVIEYAVSSNGVTKPSTGWSTNIPTVTPGQFLWTRTTWRYTDSTNEVGYSVAQAGTTGERGKQIFKSSYESVPHVKTHYWSDLSPVPSVENPPKIGDTVITPSGNILQIDIVNVGGGGGGGTFGVGDILGNIKGASGKDGIPGKPGADGKTPYFHTAWADSVDGKINFSLTDATNRGYLGTYTDFTQADSTDTTRYAWSLIKGRDGSDGAPGKAGTDGKTPYFHQAWADSKDGKVNFNTTDPTNRGYLGTYSDFTQADSTDPTKYFWVELVGALSIGGRNYLLDTNTPWQIQGSGGANQTSSWLFTFGTIKQAPFKDGEYVTVSFDYINVGSGAYGTMFAQLNNTPWVQFGVTEAMKDNGHVVRTVQWKSDWTTSGMANGIQIRMDNVATTRTVTVYNMQFERGNKATDHKVAPEDTQGQIDKVNSGLADTNSKIAAVTKVDSQATAPTNPKKGDQWWVKDANGNINAFKIWDGTKWADSIIQQSAMNISTLNGNIINGATINSSNFNVAFDETEENTGRHFGDFFKGTQVIKNGSYLSDYQVKGTTQTGFTHITPDGLISRINNSDGSLLSQVTMGLGQLSLEDTTNSGDLYPGDVERTSREVWTTSDGVNAPAPEVGFQKQFRRVWLDGKIAVMRATNANQNFLFKLKNKKLYPSESRFISVMSLADNPQTAIIRIDPDGSVVCVSSHADYLRCMAEGTFYLL